jgi:hypothetical protein
MSYTAEMINGRPEPFMGKIMAHHFNWGEPGEQPERIWQVIRGGDAAKLKPGAEVQGHGHVHPAFVDSIKIGTKQIYYTEDGRKVMIELTQIDGLIPEGLGEGMIKQDGEDERGYYYIGRVVAVESPLNKSQK